MQPVAIRQRTRPVFVPPMTGAKPIHWLNDYEVSDVYMVIHPSLTATGVAIFHQGMLKTFVLSAIKEVPGARPGKTKQEAMKGIERVAWFYAEFSSLFKIYRPTTLAIEGYSYGSKNSHSHSLGELGGVLRLAAHDCRLRTIIVPPNNLKQFATGKGNVGKGVVSKEAFKRWGIDVNDDNEADAGVLSLMASSYEMDAPLTAFQETAMKKVELMSA
jgi:crossover junction endodeoxyribonuclease RuvC